MVRRQDDDGAEILNWHSYRSDRVFAAAGKWFFHTREGTVEGPFENQMGAEYRINVYIQIMNSHFHLGNPEISLKLG